MPNKLFYVLVVLGVGLFADNYRLHGRVFEWHDINNHETIALILLAVALGLAL